VDGAECIFYDAAYEGARTSCHGAAVRIVALLVVAIALAMYLLPLR
jgi:hypothetical protein